LKFGIGKAIMASKLNVKEKKVNKNCKNVFLHLFIFVLIFIQFLFIAEKILI